MCYTCENASHFMPITNPSLMYIKPQLYNHDDSDRWQLYSDMSCRYNLLSCYHFIISVI
jgi:hypothetical protein